jgi:hypothetical protein
MTRCTEWCFVFFVALAAGCSNKSPAGPTPPAAPTISGLVITGADAVLTSVSATYIATATMSDGIMRTVTPTWTISNQSVASVDSAGHLEGRAHGSANLTATFEGRAASRAVQVVNNYRGSWSGRYVINVCDQRGFSRWCDTAGHAGRILPIALELSQTAANLSEIRGTLVLNPSSYDINQFLYPGAPDVLGHIEQSLSGAVTSDGRLILAGSSTIPAADWEGTFLFKVASWETNLSGPGVMTGRLVQGLHLVACCDAYQEDELVTMTQTSTGAIADSPPRRAIEQ